MKKKTKCVCVCGHFGFGKNLLNGQTIKTKIITEGLKRKLGKDQVLNIDTHGGKRNLLSLPFSVFGMLVKCRNIVMLPAYNGLRVITPVLFLENIFFKRKLHYIVIGGWLSDFLKNKKLLLKMLKKFDYIYVETNTMKKSLENKGFENVVVMPNCKDLKIVDEENFKSVEKPPYKLCTFSRVMREKGIEDAIEAIKFINEKYGYTVFTLDVYGQVDNEQKEWFELIKASFPDYVRYGGLISFDKSVDILKDYFALLFPTHFYTEGIPGTIIDAYASGIPVISSLWENYGDVVDEGITGLSYEFLNIEDLKRILEKVAESPEIIVAMKKACVRKAEKFTTEEVISIICLE